MVPPEMSSTLESTQCVDDIVRAPLLFAGSPLNILPFFQPDRLDLCQKPATEILLSDPTVGKSPIQIEVFPFISSSGFRCHVALLSNKTPLFKIRNLNIASIK